MVNIFVILCFWKLFCLCEAQNTTNLGPTAPFHSEIATKKFGFENEIIPMLKSDVLKVLHLQLSSFHIKEKIQNSYSNQVNLYYNCDFV